MELECSFKVEARPWSIIVCELLWERGVISRVSSLMLRVRLGMGSAVSQPMLLAAGGMRAIRGISVAHRSTHCMPQT